MAIAAVLFVASLAAAIATGKAVFWIVAVAMLLIMLTQFTQLRRSHQRPG
jgi:hypothetical protein